MNGKRTRASKRLRRFHFSTSERGRPLTIGSFCGKLGSADNLL
jgi:hypothetical protein